MSKYEKRRTVTLARSLLLVCGVFAPLTGFAGSSGTITFSPVDTAAIPVLGNAMLVLLAAGLALIGLKVARQRGVSPMVAGLLGGAALTAVTGGTGLVESARAAIEPIPITNPSGETLSIDSGTVVYENAAGVTLEITAIDLNCEGCEVVPSVEPPACAVGLRLENENQCRLQLPK